MTRINQLPLASQISDEDYFIIRQGSTDKKIPYSLIRTSELPSQTGHNTKFLTTNGTTASWAALTTELPSQTGQSGKVLSTNGTTPNWATDLDVDTLTAGTVNANAISLTGSGITGNGDINVPSNTIYALAVNATTFSGGTVAANGISLTGGGGITGNGDIGNINFPSNSIYALTTAGENVNATTLNVGTGGIACLGDINALSNTITGQSVAGQTVNAVSITYSDYFSGPGFTIDSNGQIGCGGLFTTANIQATSLIASNTSYQDGSITYNSILAIDFGGRNLYDGISNSVALDWNNRQLKRDGGSVALDWGNFASTLQSGAWLSNTPTTVSEAINRIAYVLSGAGSSPITDNI